MNNYPEITLQQAKAQQGLRMIVVPDLPSPWSEAAKGILHIKQIPWAAVRLDQRSDEQAAWSGRRDAPVAIYNDEAPRAGWDQILLLAERLSAAGSPSLLPQDPEQRALVMGLSHEICGEQGLGWTRRLDSVHKGLNDSEITGFPKPIAGYLGKKYGYQAEQGASYSKRAAALLTMLSQRLSRQHKQQQSRFYVGNELTAVDIYSACFMAYFSPLDNDNCPMPESMRRVFEAKDATISAALKPNLLEHRDFIYQHFLPLPLSL